MNTGTSDRAARPVRLSGGALVLCCLLAGCNTSGGQGFSFASAGGTGDAQTGPVVPKSTQTSLARGAVTLKAPRGYCIDDTSVSNGLQGSSALLAKCSALDGKAAGPDAAVMTVSISPRRGAGAGAPSADDLADAVAPHQVLSRAMRGELALVQVASGADAAFAPADPVHWRGATELDTRLVLLGLFAPEGSAMRGAKGGDMLATLARGISATRGTLFSRAAPAGMDADGSKQETQPEGVSNTEATDTVEPEKKGLRKLIGGLLNRS